MSSQKKGNETHIAICEINKQQPNSSEAISQKLNKATEPENIESQKLKDKLCFSFKNSISFLLCNGRLISYST